jgi:hypothetical protein
MLDEIPQEFSEILLYLDKVADVGLKYNKIPKAI